MKYKEKYKYGSFYEWLLTLWCKLMSIDWSLFWCWCWISNGAILSNRIDCRHEFKSKLNLSFYLGVIGGRLVIWGEDEGIKEAASHHNLSCSEADLQSTSPTTPFPLPTPPPLPPTAGQEVYHIPCLVYELARWPQDDEHGRVRGLLWHGRIYPGRDVWVWCKTNSNISSRI